MEKWEMAIQDAYLYQQGLDYTEKNVEEFGLSGELELLKETNESWIILHDNESDRVGKFLNVVRKQTFSNGRYDMTSVESI